MGFLDKVMFWKKDEDLDFDKLAQDTMNKEEAESPGSWGMEHTPLGSPDRPLFPQDAADSQGLRQVGQQGNSNLSGSAPFVSQNNATGSSSFGRVQGQSLGSAREVELINSKLDTIKAMLGSIEQRLGVLEQEKREQKKLW